MYKCIHLIVCLLVAGACNVEHYEDCEDEGPFEGASGGNHSRAGSGSGATAATGGGTDQAGGSDGAQPGEPPLTPCEDERDCAPGFNCSVDLQCLPSEHETCGELPTEQECTDRPDCTPIYGGTNCSCGADCECVGGEPGCVCENFEFFLCKPAE